MMGLLLIASIFCMVFYMLPFLSGYFLARNGRFQSPRRVGWAVLAVYGLWMLFTWVQEGYAPVSIVRLVSLESAMAKQEFYYVLRHLALIVLTLFVVYRGAVRGVHWARLRRTKLEAPTVEPSL